MTHPVSVIARHLDATLCGHTEGEAACPGQAGLAATYACGWQRVGAADERLRDLHDAHTAGIEVDRG